MTPQINFLPWRRLARQRRRYIRMGTLIAVVVLMVGNLWGGWIWLHQHILVLQEQASGLENQHRLMQDELHQQQVSLQQKTQQQQGTIIEEERQRRVARWGTLLTQLASSLPENSWLQSLHWSANRLVLEGYTSEMEDIETIDVGLKQLPGSFNIKAGSVSYQAAQGLAYTFTLEDVGGTLVTH